MTGSQSLSEPKADGNNSSAGAAGTQWQLLALVPGALFMLIYILRVGLFSSVGFASALVDDAMISMTYARTLAQTGELVWFPGAPRVQGFTNPFWTFVMSVIHRFGFEGGSAELFVMLLGAGIILLTGLMVAKLVRLVLDESRFSLVSSCIAGGVIPFVYSLTYWTLGGMEVGLLALCSVGILYSMFRAFDSGQSGEGIGWWIGLGTTFAVLGVLTRFDFVIVAIGVGALIFIWRAPRLPRRTLALGYFVPVVCAIIMVLASQKAYYGDWLPNTYHLKMDGYSLQERLARGWKEAIPRAIPSILLLAFAALTAWRMGASRKVMRLVCAASGVVLLVTLYTAWVGGDAWEHELVFDRYLSVGLPTLVLATIAATASLVQIAGNKNLESGGRIGLSWLVALTGIGLFGVSLYAYRSPLGPKVVSAQFLIPAVVASVTLILAHRNKMDVWIGALKYITLASVAACLLVVTSLPSYWGWLQPGMFPTPYLESQAKLALEMRDVVKPGAKVAVQWAGSSGYFIHEEMIDLLGKSDRHVANISPVADPGTGQRYPLYPGHNKWDYEYSIERLKPDVILSLEPMWNYPNPPLETLGYRELCIAGQKVWVLNESSRVEWTSFTECGK